MGWLRRWLVPAVGGCVLALALAIVLANDSIGLDLEPLSILGADGVVLALAVLAAVVVLAIHVATTRATGSSATGEEEAEAITFPPSTRLEPDRWVLTEPVDETLEPPEIGETTYDMTTRGKARRSTRNRAQRLAIETLASVEGRPQAEAAQRVHDGAWTDDPRAAAFVGYGQSLPLRTRFVDWLTGARYRRGLEATLAELERLEASSTDGAAASGSRAGERSDRAVREVRA